MKQFFKNKGAAILAGLAALVLVGSVAQAQPAPIPSLPDTPVTFDASAAVSGTSVTISVTNGTLSRTATADVCIGATPADPLPHPISENWWNPVAKQTSPVNTAQITSGILSGQTIPVSVQAGVDGTDCFEGQQGTASTFSGSRTFTNLAGGSYTVNVRVTDNLGRVANRSVSFTISASTPTCLANPLTVTPGQTTTITASGGTGSYTWSATGGSPSTGSGTQFTTSYGTAGAKTITVTSGGQSSTCTVQVQAAQAVSCSPSTQSAVVNTPVTLTATGGSSGTYSWSTPGSSSATPSGTNNANLSVAYGTTGAKNVTVTRNGVVSTACVVNVTGGGIPPTLNISASPNPVQLNHGPTITWETSDATNCWAPTANEPYHRWYWTGNKNPNGSSELALPHTTLASRLYALTCSNASGQQTTRTVTVDTVDTPVSPIGVTLTANPASGNSPLNTTLAWTTSGSPTSCTALANPENAQWSGSKSVSGGSQQITGLTQTTTFTITCSKNGASPVSASAQVVVNGVTGTPPNVTLTPNPASGTSPLTSTINYQTGLVAGQAGSCTAWSQPTHQQWNGTSYSPANSPHINKYGGNKVIANITQNTTFYLECYNEYGSAIDSKTVTVTQPTGTVVVESNIPTTWTVSGQATLAPSPSPSTGQQYTNQPTGTYTISNVPTTQTYNGVQYTRNPITPASSQTLSANGSIVFTITYTPVPSGPSITIGANPTTVKQGGASTLTWSSANIVSGTCVASASPANLSWTGSKADSGNQSTGSLTSNTLFTITCDTAGGGRDSGGTISANVTVFVSEEQPPGDDDDDDNPPQCSDGIDNDGDGFIDYPDDPGCEDPLDNNEANAPAGDDEPIHECNDGFDNDGDGFIDDEDPGCAGGSTSERGSPDIREI